MFYGGHFDVDKIISDYNEVQSKLSDQNIWNDQVLASELNSTSVSLKKTIDNFTKLRNEIVSAKELLEVTSDEDYLAINDDMNSEYNVMRKNLDNLTIYSLLNGEYDNNNCYLEIHPGAGGTEACDWADILLRMYERYCEKNNFTYEVLDELPGEEAGIKSVTIKIKGSYAYGKLKGEHGVHRLVRISPFDSNSRRHTSFASVSITPEIKVSTDIEIKESDLKIDVYHSSGAGGQSVNTSNSAVRITHIPTKIVVTCQVERSQMKNKDMAMEMLYSKLYQLKKQAEEAKENSVKGVISDINFGNQIRSYVLVPYKLVKDNRTNYETSNADDVLDGNINEFIEEYLRWLKNE